MELLTYEQYLEEVKDLREKDPEIFKIAKITSWADEEIAKNIYFYMKNTGIHAPQAIWQLYIED